MEYEQERGIWKHAQRLVENVNLQFRPCLVWKDGSVKGDTHFVFPGEIRILDQVRFCLTVS